MLVEEGLRLGLEWEGLNGWVRVTVRDKVRAKVGVPFRVRVEG